MAEDIVSLKIDLDANNADLTLGELEQKFEELNKQIKNVPRNSKEFKQLNAELASTGREIKNIELGFEALDNEQVASELGSVAGAVGDVTAAFVLLGGENETMQEVAAGVEKALAISVGFKGAIEGVSSAFKLYNNLAKQGKIATLATAAASKIAAAGQAVYTFAVGGSTGALKAFRIALASTGVGLIIIGIAKLIENFDVVKSLIKSVASAIYEFLKPAFDVIKSGLMFLGIVSSDYATEEEKNAKRREEATRKEAEERIKILRSQLDELEKSKETEKRITDEKVANIDYEIRKRQAAGKDTSKLEKEKLQLLVASALKEVEIEQQKVELLQAEWRKQLKMRGFNNEQINEFIKKYASTSNALKAAQSNLKSLSQDLEIFEIEQNRKKIEREQKQNEELKKLSDERVEIKKAETIQAQELRAKEEEQVNTNVSGMMSALNGLAAEEQKKHEERIARLQAEDEARQKQFDTAQSVINGLNALGDLLIKNEAKRQKFKKGIAVAQLALDTARAISSGIASASAVPFPANIPAILSTVATVLANVAQAKKLLSKANVPAPDLGNAASGSVQNGGVGGVAINPVSNASTVTGANTQVYVTETDITSVQNRVNVIEQQSTF